MRSLPIWSAHPPKFSILRMEPSPWLQKPTYGENLRRRMQVGISSDSQANNMTQRAGYTTTTSVTTIPKPVDIQLTIHLASAHPSTPTYTHTIPQCGSTLWVSLQRRAVEVATQMPLLPPHNNMRCLRHNRPRQVPHHTTFRLIRTAYRSVDTPRAPAGRPRWARPLILFTHGQVRTASLSKIQSIMEMETRSGISTSRRTPEHRARTVMYSPPPERLKGTARVPLTYLPPICLQGGIYTRRTHIDSTGGC